MAKWLHHTEEEDDEEATSSADEEEAELVEEQVAPAEEQVGPSGRAAAGGASSGKLKIKLGGSGEDVCHVCGKRGHSAGFRGSVYFDCPNKPCYLCGTQGHSTMTCPFRVAPGHGCTAAAGTSHETVLSGLLKRERDGRQRSTSVEEQHRSRQRWQIDAAVLRLHSRRVTCLEFHPTQDHLVISGDKGGQIAVWDYSKVFERTVYEKGSINKWLTNALRFLPGGDGSACATTSFEGTVKVFDVETGASRTAFAANEASWENVVEEEKAGRWVTTIGLDVIPGAGALAAGDSTGRLHLVDPRSPEPICSAQLHKKRNKVQSVHCNPADNNLLLTAGNDYQAKIIDIRRLVSSGASAADAKGKGPAAVSPAELASLPHPRVINSAFFSPLSGSKILTTCQDNRIRVWDYLASLQQTADREIVHSQNHNRHLSPFRAEWDPKDPHERIIMCGRYISEDFGGVALHPVDVMDASTGALLGQLTDPNLTTISPVNKPHPRCDVIISGSSRSLYAWQPAQEESEEEEEGGRQAARRSSGSSAGVRQPGGNGALPFNLQGSANYVFFDADQDADKAKKKAKGAADTSAGTKQQQRRQQSRGGGLEEDDEEEE